MATEPTHNIIATCHSSGIELSDLARITRIDEYRLLNDNLLSKCEKVVVLATLLEHHDAFMGQALTCLRSFGIPLPEYDSPFDRTSVLNAVSKLFQDARDELSLSRIE